MSKVFRSTVKQDLFSCLKVVILILKSLQMKQIPSNKQYVIG